MSYIRFNDHNTQRPILGPVPAHTTHLSTQEARLSATIPGTAAIKLDRGERYCIELFPTTTIPDQDGTQAHWALAELNATLTERHPLGGETRCVFTNARHGPARILTNQTN